MRAVTYYAGRQSNAMDHQIPSHRVAHLSEAPRESKVLDWGQIGLLTVLALVVPSLGAFSQLASAQAQTGAWTWVGGSNTLPGFNQGEPGVYGTLGVPGFGNVPGGRQGAVTWTDVSGNFWLFGGRGYDSVGSNFGDLNDLWKFNASDHEWTWMSGSSTLGGWGRPGIYGTLGVPAIDNVPGGRNGGASWIDSEGNLWLFGGSGRDINSSAGDLNDLWEFSPSSGQWTWMGGSNVLPSSSGFDGQPGVYGTLGVPAATNVPGGRAGAVAWVDISGNFWLFGGMGYDSVHTQGNLNDLWQFNPSTRQWTWMSGSNTVGSNSNQPGSYGTLGIPAAGNVPGGRRDATSWTDSGGNFWLFGGFGSGASVEGWLNDLWEFNPSTLEWTWMGGSTGQGQSGVYGALGVASTGNVPGARISSLGWSDPSGNLWLLGGNGYDSAGARGDLNDLWQFNPFNQEWTWIGGSNTIGFNGGQGGVYGTLGVAAAGNVPGSRQQIAGWTDTQGNLWLFGGNGYVVSSSPNSLAGYLNDLWEYQPSAVAFPAASQPTFSLGSGTYSTPQTVSIADATPNAVIYYTADGTTPTLNSAVYTGPIIVNATETIQAIATATNYTQSLVASANYRIEPQAAPPVFSLASGSYTSVQTLTITDTTPGAVIRYTTDGTPPTIYSTIYSSPISISSTETVQAIAIASGYLNSTATSASYSITVPAATPTFSPAPGSYTNPVIVTISDATKGATIFYNTDGITWNVYSGPITVTTTETIQAGASAVGYGASAIASATYTIMKTPAIVWTTPAPITYGTPLSASQLNATANVPGTFTYTPAAGTILGSGIQQLAVMFTPTDSADYSTANAAVQLIVNKAAPVITWPTPAAIIYGTALSAAQLNATANVPGTFSYGPAAGSVLAAGTLTLHVTFTPTDSTDYTTATSSVLLTVNKATPVITWPTPASIGSGTPLSSTQLNAAANVPSTFAYSPAAGTILPVGTNTLNVTLTPTDAANYTTAGASVALVVNAPNFTFAVSPNALAVKQGGKASTAVAIAPTGGFTGSVTLSASGLPKGVTAAFSTNPTQTGSIITFTATNGATLGTSVVTITGRSGSLNKTTSITLTVAHK